MNIQSFKRTIKQLLARKGRSFLTILGIIIGVAGVIIIISLGAGAQALVLGQITKLGTNLIGVLPGKSNESGPPAAVFGVQITTLSIHDKDAMQDKSRAPFITDVAAFVRGSAKISSGKKYIDTNFTATNASVTRVQNMDIEVGSFFSDAEDQTGSNVMVLGSEVRDELFPIENPIGQLVKIKNVPFRVVGVLKKQGTIAFQNQDDQVYIPLSIGQRELLGINYIQFIRAKVDDAAHVKTSMEDMKQILREEHHIKNPGDGDDFSVRDLADAIKILTSITNALRLFLGIMAGISLIVGGIGIMNIMLVTVSERTREIGLRKALGATSAAIRNQFLTESVILTASGGIFGMVFGIIISYLIAIGARLAGYDWVFVISPIAIIVAIGVSMLVGVIFGLYPAMKASKLDPIVALRYE